MPKPPQKQPFLPKKTFDLLRRNKGLACPNKHFADETFVPARPIKHSVGGTLGSANQMKGSLHKTSHPTIPKGHFADRKRG